MKNLKFLFLFSIGMFVSSCDNAIDIIQDGELLEPNAFQTIADMELALNGTYRQFNYENGIGFSSIFTDEVKIGFANGGQGLSGGEYGFVLDPASGDAGSIWASNYRMINFANRLIRGSQFVTVDPDNAAQVQSFNNILGQAHALRAFAHLQLMTYFSEDMTDNNALGVIKMDYVPDAFGLQLTRNTNAEVYELIESDLEFAEANIISNLSATRTFVSKSFVFAMRARMFAYRELYTQAETNVDALVALLNLTPKANYPAIWQDAPIVPPTNNEVIFKLERTGTGDNRIGGIWFSVDHTISGSPFYEVSNALHNIMNPTNAAYATVPDIRYQTTFGSGSVLNDPLRPQKVLLLNKYPSSEGLPRLNDVKIFRMGEMHLIKAEARIAAGDLAGCAALLNNLRAVRLGVDPATLTPPVYANVEQAWADVLRERRVELAFEGHRYVDLRRLGEKANAAIDRTAIDCAINSACSLPIGDYRFVMPIPVIELNANSNIQQNPNY